ncbi:hypothetical protein JCM14469_10810 [Desulfatiferula olefinivorans]
MSPTRPIFKHAIVTVLLFFLFVPGVCRAFDAGPLSVHGFVSQGYLRTTANDYLARTEGGSTEFNDVAINVSRELTDRLRVGCQFIARDLGDAGNNKVNLDWGYGDYRFRDELGLRVGKVKRPMGLFNEGRDVDLLRTCILLPQSVYREDMRDISNAAKGGALYGTIPAASLGSFDYQHVYGSKDLDLDSVALRRQFLNRFPGADVGDIQTNIRYTDTTHVFWNVPIKGLRLGVSYEQARIEAESPAVPDIPTSDPDVVIEGQPARRLRIDLENVWMGSVEYRRGNLMLTAEVLDTVQRFTMDSGAAGYDSRKGHSIGYYGGIDYRFTRWLEVAAYYSVYYPNKKDRSGRDQTAYGRPDYMGWQKDACLSFRFDPLPGWICKLEGHVIDGAAQVFDYQDPFAVEEHWGLFAAKVTYMF